MNDICTLGPTGLDRYLDAVEHLPPTPTFMLKLIELFRRPDRDVDEIVVLLEQDPSLTTEVLRRCNSSFFGHETPVTDINEAVFRLGFYEVYRLTVALFGLQAMSTAKMAKSVPVEKLWRHSAVTAIIGGAMARDLGESEGIVFTAGLLHDVGKIVLASAEGARYGDLLAKHGDCGATLSDAERAAFGFNHSEVGARLLNRWHVPEEVFMPVLFHHETEWSGPFERSAAIVSLANLMAHCIDKTGAEKPCELPEAVHAMELLKLNHESMMRLEELAREDVEQLSSLFAAPGGS
jgi:putative nucleotidyltransferase with HDIG domain